MALSGDEHVFLNGRLVPAGRAVVSVFDRGLLYGDGLFETLRAYRGVVFAFDRHLRRLRLSAATLGIPVPEFDWPRVVARLLRRNGLHDADAWVRLTLTRGAAEPGLLPPAAPRPTVILMARPVDPRLPALQRRGVAVVTLPFAHDSFLAEHKTLHYLPAVLGKGIARRARAHEGLYALPDGTLREGTTSSLFVLRRGVLCTPPGHGILPGITRETVLRLAETAGLRERETELRADDLYRGEEAFLGASVSELIPIVRADGRRIGSGRPGPVTRQLQRLYREHVEQQCAPCGGPRRSTDSGRRSERK